MRILAATALAVALLPPAPGLAADGPKVVHLKTQDGLDLEADWYQGAEGMPGIVGLHMYPADRTSWKPLAEKRPPGFHFLAVDLRGYGGSRVQGGKDLSERVKAREPQHFQSMWQDAAAAVKFLRGEAKCDPKRIGIVGASVGCSLAIDTAVRDGKVAGVACLSPGTNYFGIPSIDHVKSWPAGTPLLLVSPEGEAEGGAKPLAAELKGRSEVEVRTIPGGRELHGTLLLPKVENRLGKWVECVLGRQILDGVIDRWEECGGAKKPHGWDPRIPRDAEVHSSVTSTAPGAMALDLWFRRDPVVSTLSGVLEVVVTLVDDEGEVTENRRLRGMASGDGTLLKAWLDTWREDRWVEEPLGSLPGTAVVREGVLEAHIPWAVFGITKSTAVVCRCFVEGDLGGNRPSPIDRAEQSDQPVMDYWEGE